MATGDGGIDLETVAAGIEDACGAHDIRCVGIDRRPVTLLDDGLCGQVEEHLVLEGQLAELQKRLHLSTDEEVEKKRLQKLKLIGKDRIMEILSKYR